MGLFGEGLLVCFVLLLLRMKPMALHNEQIFSLGHVLSPLLCFKYLNRVCLRA